MEECVCPTKLLVLEVMLPRKNACVAWEIDASGIKRLSMSAEMLWMTVRFVMSGMEEAFFVRFVVTDWKPLVVWTLG